MTTVIAIGVMRDGKIHCSSCHDEQPISEDRKPGLPPTYVLFAQEYLDGDGAKPKRLFKPATDKDRALVVEAAEALRKEELRGVFAPSRPIPIEGRKDRRPILYGFASYRDLFNPRQLLHLTTLGKRIEQIQDKRERGLFGIAFSEHLATNCMYTAYAFGYRRTSALFSFHGFRHITRPVELNPWLHRIGRGTFPNALDKIDRAIAFAKSPSDLSPRGGRVAASRPIGVQGGVSGDANEVLERRKRAAIVTASSSRLSELPAGCIDLVLTDPPYLDNVSYSELSDFYLAWHQSLRISDAPYDDPLRAAPMADSLAAVDRRDESIRIYQERLSLILRECTRVLRKDGVCVFTYHHEAAGAWSAIAGALARSGLRCTAVIPMRGEGQGGLHTFDGTIKWDAVLVCRPREGGIEVIDPCKLRVSRRALAAARAACSTYHRRLGRHKGIGFREPDRLNLFRAMVAASASVTKVPGDLGLDDALSAASFSDAGSRARVKARGDRSR